MTEQQIARPFPSPGRAMNARRFEMKRAGVLVSAVQTDGAFEGYASLFGIADQARDVVMPGAFRDSLARRGAGGVKMLWQHDPALPIGVWSSIAEDARGLHVVGRLDLAVAKARELHALMRSGAVDGLSIGFRTERSRKDPKTGLRRLERIDLWEISLVTFPMLAQARVSAVKTAPLVSAVKTAPFVSAARDEFAPADVRLVKAIRSAEEALR